MKIVRRTTWSHGLGTYPRVTRVRGTSTWISMLQVNKSPNCWLICNKPCSTFPHATAWSCVIKCLFKDNKYAIGCGSSGWHPHSTSLPNSSPAATCVPREKWSVWMKTGFVVECPFSALGKLTVNTGQAHHMHKLKNCTFSFSLEFDHQNILSTFVSVLLEGQKESKQLILLFYSFSFWELKTVLLAV